MHAELASHRPHSARLDGVARQLRSNRALQAVLTSGVAAAAGGLALALFGLPLWVNEPVHSAAEGAGSVVSVLLAAFALRELITERNRAYAWLVAGLMAIGVLDGFHAIVGVTGAFFWSRALSTCLGGVLFGCVWLDPLWTPPRPARFVGLAVLLSLAVGAGMVAMPDLLPSLLADGRYTGAARVINVVGACGYFAAAAWFVKRGARARHADDVPFAMTAALYGVGGALFTVSQTWDAVWWLFHVVRLAAPMAVLSVVYDAFQRAHDRLEERVAERTRQLSEALVVREDFLSIASHELRTPLTALRLQLEGVARAIARDGGVSSERVTRAAATSIRQVSRLERLVEDMLSDSRLRRGTLEVVKARVDLTALVRDVAARDEQRQREARNTVRLELAEGVFAWVDASRIEQVVENLLSNAAKYAPGSEVRVRLASEGEAAALEVSDTGPGIPLELQRQVFERFWRHASAAHVSGLGLGMYISRQIVELHGGAITVAGGPGEGTRFTVRLPLAQAAEGSAA